MKCTKSEKQNITQIKSKHVKCEKRDNLLSDRTQTQTAAMPQVITCKSQPQRNAVSTKQSNTTQIKSHATLQIPENVKNTTATKSNNVHMSQMKIEHLKTHFHHNMNTHAVQTKTQITHKQQHSLDAIICKIIANKMCVATCNSCFSILGFHLHSKNTQTTYTCSQRWTQKNKTKISSHHIAYEKHMHMSTCWLFWTQKGTRGLQLPRDSSKRREAQQRCFWSRARLHPYVPPRLQAKRCFAD